MLIRAPCRESRQIIEYIARVCVKNMRTVFVDKNAGGIRMIVGIAADVIAAIA